MSAFVICETCFSPSPQNVIIKFDELWQQGNNNKLSELNQLFPLNKKTFYVFLLSGIEFFSALSKIELHRAPLLSCRIQIQDDNSQTKAF